MTTKRLWSYSQIRRWVGVLEYQPRELCGVQLLRQCSERAWPEHQGVEPVPTGTLKWCTATPEGIADPEGIVKWCDESLNIECQVDTKDVKLTIRTAWIHAVDRTVHPSFSSSIYTVIFTCTLSAQWFSTYLTNPIPVLQRGARTRVQTVLQTALESL